jgi:hypothetical protein
MESRANARGDRREADIMLSVLEEEVKKMPTDRYYCLMMMKKKKEL